MINIKHIASLEISLEFFIRQERRMLRKLQEIGQKFGINSYEYKKYEEKWAHILDKSIEHLKEFRLRQMKEKYEKEKKK